MYFMSINLSLSLSLSFLDFSKAFDKVDNFKLFNKLIYRGAPKKYVNLIRNWYGNQNILVKFNNKFSEQWKVKNV